MKIKVVSYSKTYQLPFASFYEKIFVQADLDEGEDARKALYECKKVVESFHYESNKADEKKEAVIKEEKQSLSQVASIIQQIGTVTELTVLKSYELIAKNDPDIQWAYDKQYKKLSGLLQKIINSSNSDT